MAPLLRTGRTRRPPARLDASQHGKRTETLDFIRVPSATHASCTTIRRASRLLALRPQLIRAEKPGEKRVSPQAIRDGGRPATKSPSARVITV